MGGGGDKTKSCLGKKIFFSEDISYSMGLLVMECLVMGRLSFSDWDV